MPAGGKRTASCRPSSSPSEIAKREKAVRVRAVIHSGYLEGFPDDMPWQSQLWMYARGEVTREQLSAYADEGRQIPANPNTPPVAAADVPEDWWQTTQARIRRNLLNTTLTEPEVAAALQISIEEVGELFEANRLTSFDLDGEERIPDWQLVKPPSPSSATRPRSNPAWTSSTPQHHTAPRRRSDDRVHDHTPGFPHRRRPES